MENCGGSAGPESSWGWGKESVPPCRHQQPPWDSRTVRFMSWKTLTMLRSSSNHVMPGFIVIHVVRVASETYEQYTNEETDWTTSVSNQSALVIAGHCWSLLVIAGHCWSLPVLPSQRTAPCITAIHCCCDRFTLRHATSWSYVGVRLWGAIATWCFAASCHSEYGAMPCTSELSCE